MLVLTKSPCLRDLNTIATVLSISKSSIEDIVKCVEYPNTKRKIDIMVIKKKNRYYGNKKEKSILW